MASASEARASAAADPKNSEGRTAKAIREAASAGNGSDPHASNLGSRSAEISHQMTNEIMASAREVAGTINKKLTEVTFDQTRKLLDDTTRAAVAYQEGTTGTNSGLQALLRSYAGFSLGLSQLPQTCFETMAQATRREGRRKPVELLQCRTPSDFAELQMSLYNDAMTDAIEVSMAMFRVVGTMTQNALKPLQKTT